MEKQMLPSWAYVKEFLDLFSNGIAVSGLPFEMHDVKLTPIGNKLELEFESDQMGEVMKWRVEQLGEITLSDGNSEYIIPTGKGHISDMGVFTLRPKIEISEIRRVIKDDERLFMRYYLPIGYNSVLGEFEYVPYAYENGKFAQIVVANIRGNDVHLMYFPSRYNNFLVIEPQVAMTIKELMDITYAIQVAYGFICGTIHLDNAIIVAADDLEFSHPIGLLYKSLTESVTSQYPVMTFNSHYVAEEIALCQSNGTPKDISELEKEWQPRLRLLDIKIFESLVEHIIPFDKFYRTILILQSSSKASLEYQAAIYCLALENICGLAQKEKNIKDEKMLREEDWEYLKAALLDVMRQKVEEKGLDDAEHFLEVSIKAINKPTNRDKLTKSFVACGYTPIQEELDAIDERNRFLHGHNPNKVLSKNEDENLIYYSLMIHRLCCILILKLCGYTGYIRNNVRILFKMMPTISLDHQPPFMQI